MKIKNNLDFLQKEIKHLQILKNKDEEIVNKYENNLFPSSIENFFQNKLSLLKIQAIDNINKNDKNNKDLNISKKIEINKDLLTLEKSKALLGSYYQLVSDFFISLRKNEKIIVYILNNIKGESQNLLINYISLLYYENVFELQNNISLNSHHSNEIILNEILTILIEKELEEIIDKGHNFAKFLDNSLASKIIKNFLKKEDVQKYLREIFFEIITDIIEMGNKNVFMEPNRIRDYLNKRNPLLKKVTFSETTNKEEKKKKNIPKDENFTNSANNLPRGSVMIDYSKAQNFLYTTNSNFDNSHDLNSLNRYTYTISDKNVLAYNIENILYDGLTHSRLLYGIKEQRNYLNQNKQENDSTDCYKSINIDEFLQIKENIPEINIKYSKNDLSQKELNDLYNKAIKSNKYMEEFYYKQLKELQRDPTKNFSNMEFIKFLKKNFQSYLDRLIPQYKKNFEKIKYFIDKMIFKLLQNKKEKIPFCIKNIVSIIRNYLIKRVKNIDQIEINRFIYEFFIGKIIIPFLTNTEFINFITGKEIDLESKTFLFYFAKIIKKIFRSNFYESFEQHFTIFNNYICEILPYINSIIFNMILGNNSINDKESIKDENQQIENINRIIKYESIILNEKIMKIIFEFLIESINNIDNNTNNNNSEIKKLMAEDNQLNGYFQIISQNYKEIIQTMSIYNDISVSDNVDDNNNINNNKELDDNNKIFGGPFFILLKGGIERPKNEIISLATYNKEDIKLNILPKIKYSLMKILELIPQNIFLFNFQLFMNKKIISIFNEIKNIINKNYVFDFTNVSGKNEKENQISIIWYIDYFLNYKEYLPDEYKDENFEKLFEEIRNKIKNDILLYQNDLSQYSFKFLINFVNEKTTLMNNLFNYYNNNIFSHKINNYIFNSMTIKIDIYEYFKDDKKFVYFNKIMNMNKDNKEINFIQNISIEKVSDFIDYISNHINNENILTNFCEIEKNFKKSNSQINNINVFLEEYLLIIKNHILNELRQENLNNNTMDNNNLNEDIEIKEKENIETIMNIIEELIQEKIYKKIWSHNATDEDKEIYKICKNKLNNIIPHDIGINEKYINEHIWENIIYLINTKYDLDCFKTPMTKIKCVGDIYNILNKSINVITSKKDSYSVDDIFPIFVYLLIQIKPKRLFSNLNFIKLLINKKNLIKSSGFALTQLEMAINYLLNL